MTHALTLVAALFLAQGYEPPTRLGTAPLERPDEERVQALGKMLRCPVCQGVSIADSPSSMARAQLDKVRELVKEGQSDQEIYDFFVARYGEWILMEPTKSGLNVVLWLGPVVLLLLGLSVVVLVNASRSDTGAPQELTLAPTTSLPAPVEGPQRTPAVPAAPDAPAPPSPASDLGRAGEGAPPPATVDPFLAQVRADLER